MTLSSFVQRGAVGERPYLCKSLEFAANCCDDSAANHSTTIGVTICEHSFVCGVQIIGCDHVALNGAFIITGCFLRDVGTAKTVYWNSP